MKNQSNLSVLVTGASRGIGATIARLFAENNYTVIGTATSESGAKKISQTLKAVNSNCLGLRLDVTDLQDIQNCHDNLNKQNISSPQILINNAGITKDNLVMRMKQEEWDDVIETNLNSVFRVTQIFLKNMLKARYGRIISISSVVGSTGNSGQANYAATKAALSGFTKSIAQELGSRNITANCIAPGFIKTDMTDKLPDNVKQLILNQIPLNRLGEPSDIAKMALFLAQQDYITGQTFHVNGGMYLN